MSTECQERTFAHTKKNSAISVRLPDAIKKAASKAAAADTRSVASLVEKLLTDWLRAEGYLK